MKGKGLKWKWLRLCLWVWTSLFLTMDILSDATPSQDEFALGLFKPFDQQLSQQSCSGGQCRTYCQSSNPYQAARNYGWLYLGYLYPSLLRDRGTNATYTVINADGSTSTSSSRDSNNLLQSGDGFFALSACDMSYCLLHSIFGSMTGVMGQGVANTPYCYNQMDNMSSPQGAPIISGGVSASIATMMLYFNTGIIAVAFVLIAYHILMGGFLLPAIEGDIVDRNFTIYSGIRIVSGLGLLAPYLDNGYSLLQIILMYIIMLGVGFADRAVNLGLDQFYSMRLSTDSSTASASPVTDAQVKSILNLTDQIASLRNCQLSLMLPQQLSSSIDGLGRPINAAIDEVSQIRNLDVSLLSGNGKVTVQWFAGDITTTTEGVAKCGQLSIPVGVFQSTDGLNGKKSWSDFNQLLNDSSWLSLIIPQIDSLYTNLYTRIDNLCSGSGRPEACTQAIVPEAVITSPYAYLNYFANGCRPSGDGTNPCSKGATIFNVNDAVLISYFMNQGVFDTNLAPSPRSVLVGQTVCAPGTGVYGQVCLKLTAGGLSDDESKIAITKGEADYQFNRNVPTVKQVIPAAAARINQQVLSAQSPTSDVSVVSLLGSIKQYFSALINMASRTADTGGNTSAYLDKITYYILSPFYNNGYPTLLKAGGQMSLSTFMTFAASLFVPPAPKSLTVSLLMVVERVLGFHYFETPVNASNYFSDRDDSAINQNCRTLFQQNCTSAQAQGCFNALRTGGCFLTQGQMQGGFLGATAYLNTFLNANSASGGAPVYYNPYQDFVDIGIKIMESVGYYMFINSQETAQYMAGFTATRSAVDALVALAMSVAESRMREATSVSGWQRWAGAYLAAEWVQSLLVFVFNLPVVLADYYNTIGFTILGFLFPIGFLMAILIPIYPVLIFIVGVFAWLVSVVEALFAAPIIALGLAHPDGHDFFGKSTDAVLLILSSALRPILMVLGVFLSVILLQFVFVLLNVCFVENLSHVLTYYGSDGVLTSEVFMFLIVGVLALYIYTGWELISRVALLNVSIGTKILAYLGSTSQDMATSMAGEIMGGLKDNASGMGQSIVSPAAGAIKQFSGYGTQAAGAVGGLKHAFSAYSQEEHLRRAGEIPVLAWGPSEKEIRRKNIETTRHHRSEMLHKFDDDREKSKLAPGAQPPRFKNTVDESQEVHRKKMQQEKLYHDPSKDLFDRRDAVDIQRARPDELTGLNNLAQYTPRLGRVLFQTAKALDGLTTGVIYAGKYALISTDIGVSLASNMLSRPLSPKSWFKDTQVAEKLANLKEASDHDAKVGSAWREKWKERKSSLDDAINDRYQRLRPGRRLFRSRPPGSPPSSSPPDSMV